MYFIWYFYIILQNKIPFNFGKKASRLKTCLRIFLVNYLIFFIIKKGKKFFYDIIRLNDQQFFE